MILDNYRCRIVRPDNKKVKSPEIDRQIDTAIGAIELSHRDDSGVNMSHRKYSRAIFTKSMKPIFDKFIARFYSRNYQ